MDFYDYLFSQAGLAFNRPIKNIKPYKVYECEDGYFISVDTLGINEEDIKVKMDNDCLVITGESTQDLFITKNKNDCIQEKYSQNIRLKLSDKLYHSISDIKYDTKNGVTVIRIKTKKEEPKFLISKM